MATIGYADLPVPGGAQAPTAPGDLAALATAVDPHLWQHVEDEAERDVTYASAPVHTVVTAENGSVWVKSSATENTWVTIYEPPEAWRPLSLQSGFTPDTDATPQIRRVGSRVYVRGRVRRTDGGLIFSWSPTVVAQVPTDCIPQHLATGASGQTVTGDPVTGVGRVEVFPVGWSRDGGVAGSVLWYSQDGGEGTAPGSPWVGVDIDYWID